MGAGKTTLLRTALAQVPPDTETALILNTGGVTPTDLLKLIVIEFGLEDVVTRDCPRSRPKPRPDGILYLLESWGADASSSVMVGNHVIDVEAGRAAGAATVLVAACDEPSAADLTVGSLGDLVVVLTNGAATTIAGSTLQ